MLSSPSTAKNPLFAPRVNSRSLVLDRMTPAGSSEYRNHKTALVTSVEFAKCPTTLGQCQGADPVGHLPDRDASRLFHCLHIDSGHRLHPAAGNVNGLAVRSESDPGRTACPIWLSRHDLFRQRGMSQQLDFRQRIGENRIGRLAVDPESLLVGGDTDAVAVAFAPPDAAEPFRLVRGLNSGHLHALGKIHHREAVQRAKVYEDPATRAVGVILNCDRIYSRVVLNLPSGFHLLEIEDD